MPGLRRSITAGAPNTSPTVSAEHVMKKHEDPREWSPGGLAWQVKDSNLGRRKPTDLQSAPIGRSGNLPRCPKAAAKPYRTPP